VRWPSQDGIPGYQLDGKSLFELFETNGSRFGRRAHGMAGAAAAHGQNKLKFSTMNRTVIGGSPAAADDPLLPGGLRRASLARLGHDRNEPLGTVATLKQNI